MNKDLISRQDAIKEVSKYVHSVDMIIGNGTLSMEGCRDTAEEILEGLPSMEPEPHEGHWIGGDGSYICSECNSSPMDFIETMGSSFDAYVETLMNFCPNCGADMRGVRYKCHA